MKIIQLKINKLMGNNYKASTNYCNAFINHEHLKNKRVANKMQKCNPCSAVLALPKSVLSVVKNKKCNTNFGLRTKVSHFVSCKNTKTATSANPRIRSDENFASSRLCGEIIRVIRVGKLAP